MTTSAELQASEREGYRETIAALEAAIDALRAERDEFAETLSSSIAEAYEAGRAKGIGEAACVPRCILLTEVRGLDGLTLTGPDRDDWIVRATARKVLALVESEIRALASSKAPAPATAPGTCPTCGWANNVDLRRRCRNCGTRFTSSPPSAPEPSKEE